MPENTPPPEDVTNPQWTKHFDDMIREAVRLEAACGLKVSDNADIVERVLHGDETVCGRKNAEAFRKLRNLYMAILGDQVKAINRLGAEQVLKIRNRERALADKLRHPKF